MSADITTSEEKAGASTIRPVIDIYVIMEATGKCRATIERLAESDPDFPKPHRLGTFSKVFYRDEFAAYMNNLPRASDAPVHHGGKVHLKKKINQEPKTVAGKNQRSRRTA